MFTFGPHQRTQRAHDNNMCTQTHRRTTIYISEQVVVSSHRTQKCTGGHVQILIVQIGARASRACPINTPRFSLTHTNSSKIFLYLRIIGARAARLAVNHHFDAVVAPACALPNEANTAIPVRLCACAGALLCGGAVKAHKRLQTLAPRPHCAV